MNTQVKRFIEPSNMVAFHFCCKNKACGAELSLPLQEDYSRTHAADRCPNCHEGWLKLSDVTGVTAAPLLEQLVSAIRSISTWPGQAQISLEIRPDQTQ